jgi:hypothetical protein
MRNVLHDQPMGSLEYAARARDLEELRRIRDRDLPGLLAEAWALATPDAMEEVLQAQADLRAVVAHIAELEDLLAGARASSTTTTPSSPSPGAQRPPAI